MSVEGPVLSKNSGDGVAPGALTLRPGRSEMQPHQLRHFFEARQIRHFLTVVEHQQISTAADQLGLTQPALSKSIKQLEDRLGVTLFERLPTGVRPTRYGTILARRARLMEIEFRHAFAEIRSAKEGASGTIRIGAGPLWMRGFLPPLVSAFQDQHPGIKFRLRTGVIDTLVPAVLNGDVDLICTNLDFPDHPELVKEHLVDIRHVIFARAEHPLAERHEVAAEELLKYPWIGLINDNVGQSRLRSFFATHGLQAPKIKIEVAAGFSIKSFLTQGDYLMSAPEEFRSYAEHLGLCIIKVDSNLWESPAGVAYRETSHPLPVVNAFITMLRARFPKQLLEEWD